MSKLNGIDKKRHENASEDDKLVKKVKMIAITGKQTTEQSVASTSLIRIAILC